MNSEEDEFRRIEAEAKRRAARDEDDDTQVYKKPCIGKDPQCPCQDGDACHYKDCGSTKALPVAQPEPTPWRDMVVASLVREGINKHKARELADHFAAQRPWVGLTEQDMPSGEDPMFDHQYFCAGMVYAAKVLQEKNT